MSRSGRLGIGVIGAGRVGPVLAAAFAGVGHALIGITAGSDPDRVAAIVPDVPVLPADEVVRRSELVILAVPHDELRALVAGIAELGGWQTGQLVMHVDPAFGVEVLAPAAARGAIPLAVHPAITFTGTSIDLRQLHDAFAAVTAPPAVLPIALALAVELGCEPVVVAEADRPAYGDAIGAVTEFATALVRQSASALRQVGVEEPGRYLAAVLHSATERALTAADD